MDPEAAEAGASSQLKLPILFSKLTTNVGHYYQESPLHVSASIPFRWEEEPGKPRRSTSSSTTSIISSSSKSLELPPRLLLLDAAGAAAAKLDSPTTVLKGPYITSKPRSRSSSSFRVTSKDRLYGSFNKSGARTSPDAEKGLFPSFRMGRRVKREVGGGDSYVFPSFMEGGEGDGDINEKLGKPTGSFYAISHTTRARFWETIYEGLKQVIHWRSWKSKRRDYQGV